MSENCFYSSLSGQEIEDALLGAVRGDVAMAKSNEWKARARQNIGAGSESTGFQILGYYDTLQDLIDSLQVLPQAGDAYGIGTEPPYHIYVYDGATDTWLDNGTLNIDAIIDDNDVSENSTWSSEKISADLQSKITAVGMLKGSGSAVSAATKGTDYGALAFTVALLAANWSSNQQTVLNANFLSSGYAYIVSPASASFAAYGEAQIYADDVSTDGQMIFHCDSEPSADLSVNVVRMVSA